MNIITEVRVGSMLRIHPSMGYQGITESIVSVVAVGDLASLEVYPKPIYGAVQDCYEDYLDCDLSPDEIRKTLWAVYVDDRGLNCLPLEDFVAHTTPL